MQISQNYLFIILYKHPIYNTVVLYSFYFTLKRLEITFMLKRKYFLKVSLQIKENIKKIKRF